MVRNDGKLIYEHIYIYMYRYRSVVYNKKKECGLNLIKLTLNVYGLFFLNNFDEVVYY